MNRTYLTAVAVLTMIGSSLPWFSFMDISVSGMSGDGKLTFCLGAVGVLSFWAFEQLELPRWFPRTFHAILAVLVVAIAGYHTDDISATYGIYVTIVAGIAWMGVALIPASVFPQSVEHDG